MTNETELMPCPFCKPIGFRDTGNSDYENVCCSNHAIVPLEPTEEMVNEYFDATRITLEGGASGTLAVIEGYRAMIAAAQKGGE